MTTRVTVDAHAGWPVEVIGLHGELGHKEYRIEIVQPYTKRDFYIHSRFRIVSIEELPNGK